MTKKKLWLRKRNIMSTKSQQDQWRRFSVAKTELKRLSYKLLLENLSLPFSLRMKASQKLNRLNRNSSLIRIRNRCFVTGRSRGVIRFCKLSRIECRRLALQGRLVGVQKASW
jgi:ribosomal protein S14